MTNPVNCNTRENVSLEPHSHDFSNTLCEERSELTEDLNGKIDLHRFSLVGSKNQEYNFGAYFHGFGKYLVKGANLNFKKVKREDNVKYIELSFSVNHIYSSRIRELIKALACFNPEEKTEFAKRYNAQGLSIEEKADYGQDGNIIKAAIYKVALESVGSLTIGREDVLALTHQVKVALPEGANFASFYHFLSIFGLEDALKRSSEEDLERIKLGILFKTFFPSQAAFMMKEWYKGKDDYFFTTPLAELRNEIIEQVPQMRKVLEKYAAQKVEIFPGYIRYGVPVAQKAYALGARALTTALLSMQSSDGLPHLSEIIKNGLLSKDLRSRNNISIHGIGEDRDYLSGGAHSVFTQMITERDVKNRRDIYSFGYVSIVRLYISLEALDQGSYQYFLDHYGSREEDEYLIRSNIFEFVKKEPSWFRSHEIMLPDRVLPKHIKGLTVRLEMKESIIADFREKQLIQVDNYGRETINGILVDEFIRTDLEVTADLVKYCHPTPSPQIGVQSKL